MKRIVSAFAALAVFALASTAHAQVQTGSILVRAVDEQGALMPGVTITLTSPVLVAGTMTGVTDAGGVNRFPSLVPGTYTVKIELSGFPRLPAKHRRPGRPDDAGRVRDESRQRRGEHHRDRRVADRRHDERERRRQLEQATDSGHAWRTRLWALLEAKVPSLA